MIKQLGLAAAVLAVLGTAALPASADPRPVAAWSGDVDDTTIVYIHRDDVQTRTVFGKAAGNISTQVYSRLPEGPLHVFLAHWDGRGRVSIVQQPNLSNDFTAAVRIHDPQAGRSHYDFTLAWDSQPFWASPYGHQDRYGDQGQPEHRFRGAGGY